MQSSEPHDCVTASVSIVKLPFMLASTSQNESVRISGGLRGQTVVTSRCNPAGRMTVCVTASVSIVKLPFLLESTPQNESVRMVACVVRLLSPLDATQWAA